MAYHYRRGRRFFFDFDDEDDDEFEEAIFLNPFRTSYYLGRGRFGDNSRLHRGIFLVREREREREEEGGFSPARFGRSGRRRRRGRGYRRAV